MFGLQFVNDMENFQREMDQIFRGFNFNPGLISRNNQINVKVSDQGSHYQVQAILPGLDVDKLDISILGKRLTLQGEFVQEELPEDVRWHRQERSQGHFERVLQLTDHLDADKVEAEYKNGILSIKLPKAASALPKKITVNVG